MEQVDDEQEEHVQEQVTEHEKSSPELGDVEWEAMVEWTHEKWVVDYGDSSLEQVDAESEPVAERRVEEQAMNQGNDSSLQLVDAD